MDLDSFSVEKIDPGDLERTVRDLIQIPRNSKPYDQIMVNLLSMLNAKESSSIKTVDFSELIRRNNHLVFFVVEPGEIRVPFDLNYGIWLNSDLKNRLLVMLKGNRRNLRKEEIEAVSQLERARSYCFSIDFKTLKLDLVITRCLDEMSNYESLAKLETRVPRQLDLYFAALASANQFRFELECLDSLLLDTNHVRKAEVKKWFQESIFRGNRPIFKEYKKKNFQLLDERCFGIIAKIRGVFGNLGDGDELKKLGISESWQNIGPNLGRGSSLVIEGVNHSFEKFSCGTFQKLKEEFDSKVIRAELESYLKKEDRSNLNVLPSLLVNLEEILKEMTKGDGRFRCSLKADLAFGVLSKHDRKKSEEWAHQNIIDLKHLQLEVFHHLIDEYLRFPDKFFPEDVIQKIIKVQAKKFPLEPVDLEGFKKRLTQLSRAAYTNQALEDLVDLGLELRSKKQALTNVTELARLRKSCLLFEDFETRLQEHHEVETAIENIRIKCDEQIFKCFSSVRHSGSKPITIDRIFEYLADHMLNELRHLNYSLIDSRRFEGLFEKAILMPKADSAYQLDTLLREIHLIPKHDQLQSALDAWGDRLTPEEMQGKQAFLFQNEMQLQKLVQNIRNELRECLTSTGESHWTRRNRFEVFGMGDYFGPNIQPLLEALLRMVPRVTQLKECKNLIENIEFVESKVHEAHQATSPNGSAYREVKRLSHLMGHSVLKRLLEDLDINQRDLDQILKGAREGLHSSQILLKRLGVPNGASEYLSVSISLNDLDQLQELYDFLPEIGLPEIKRFVLVYNHKIHLMEELYKRASKEDEGLTEEMKNLFNSQAFTDFKTNFRIKDTLKFEILYAMPEILEAESQLLNRTLNFVKPEQLKSKSTYNGILQVIGSVGPKDIQNHRKLRHIWSNFQRSLEKYRPERFASNFQKNARTLLLDVSHMHKLPFPLIRKSPFLIQ